MKVLRKIDGWRSWVGVIGIAALALGISLKLEGAPTLTRQDKSGEKVSPGAIQDIGSTNVEAPPSRLTPSLVINESTTRAKAGSIPDDGMPVIATIHVDWRDDEGTRLRQAGKLVGPLPHPGQWGGVATAGSCTFAIDCDDANPCTIDACDIPVSGPVGAGKCVYTPVAEGFTLVAGGCTDGNFCNGLETCQNLECSPASINPGDPCTTNDDCPNGLCYGACSFGVAPSCCADRDSCNEPFATCDEDSDNAGDPCEVNANCPGGRCDRCAPLCATAADCDDDRNCNGIESCTSKICRGGTAPPNTSCVDDTPCTGGGVCLGTCVRAANPCGAGAKCNEGYCFGGANDFPTVASSVPCNSDTGCPGGICVPNQCGGLPAGLPKSCEDNGDCTGGGNGICGNASPICYAGRCCTAAPEPVCSKAKLAACTAGRNWYAMDGGEQLLDAENLCGGSDPDDLTGDAWGCPKYSSGFTQTSAGAQPIFPVKVGPVSDSPACVPAPGGPGGACVNPLDPAGRLYEIGDDYKFENNQYMGLDVVRFVLNVTATSRLSMDVYDANGVFVEDFNVLFQANLPVQEGIVVLILNDPMTIPPAGWIVLRTSERFVPNSRAQWLSTTATSGIAGTNDTNALWVNGYPGTLPLGVPNNYLKMCTSGANINQACVSGLDCPGGVCGTAPGILAFELAGDKLGTPPTGACCPPNGVCVDSVLSWVCTNQGNVYHGDGSRCRRCNGGPNVGLSCPTPGVDAVNCPSGGQGTCSTGLVGSACTPVGNHDACDETGVCDLGTLTCANAHALGTLCSIDDDCDVEGTCVTVECVPIAGCASGACCTTSDPYCQLAMSENDCEVTIGGDWKGFGTDCDTDDGHDDAQQHTCPIPNYPGLRCMSGPNNLQTCTDDTDCRKCMGGSKDGLDCTTTSDPSTGCLDEGACMSMVCVGGLNNGASCTTDSQCADDSGVCRGRCVSRGTGGDNCMDAYVHVITVPDASEGPKTVTITGNNIPATNTEDEPENCSFNGTDPMWWEAFSIDKCARVRVDFCGSDPILEPSWGSIISTCNPDGSCAGFIGSVADPFTPGQRASSRGAPWCKEDNSWGTYGPLEAGTYWRPVYSDLAGTHDQYQFHVTVQACPTAACCKPDGSCEVTTQGDCDDENGFFLAPPQVGQAVPQCVNPACSGGNQAGQPCTTHDDCTPLGAGHTCIGTCVTGSCCKGPGNCKDEVLNQKMTEALCLLEVPPGSFIGGVRCKGGTCIGGTNVGDSCTPETAGVDCPGSSCGGTAAQFAQPIPCPICEHESSATCNFPPGSFVWLSDTSADITPTRQCDDIKATQTEYLTDVCLRGVYLETVGPGVNCSSNPSVPPGTDLTDEFTVRLYAPDPTRYFPGAILGEWETTHVTDRPNGHTITGAACSTNTVGGAFCYAEFQLSLVETPENPLVQLQVNEIYFVEISNHTAGGQADCDFWMLDAAPDQSNDYAFLDACSTQYTEDSVKLFVANPAAMRDPSWCLNVPFDPPPSPVRACCTGDAVVPCVENSIRECAQMAGDWQFDQLSCQGYVCPIEINDVCSRAPFVAEGEYEVNMFGLTLDGNQVEQCGSPPVPTNVSGDLWFKYTPTASGRVYIGTCDCERGNDEVVAVYRGTDPTICPCPGDPGMTLVECYDGAQPNHIDELGCNEFGDGADVDINVTSGNCYTVRVSTFMTAAGVPSVAGRANLRIALAPAICGNGIKEDAGGEQCDPGDPDAVPPVNPSDSLCPGKCRYNCLCPPPVCGLQCVGGIRDGLACGTVADCPGAGTSCEGILQAALGEECDYSAPNPNAPCAPEACRGENHPDGECTCVPFCGNNIRQGSETCDGTDDSLCGMAGCNNLTCRCNATCGNGVTEIGEQCDPGGLGVPPAEPSDALCTGRCIPPGGDPSDDCTCPPAFCGNDYTEELSNKEECDGLDLAGEGRCPPEECRPPGDPAGECTCSCAVAEEPPNLIVWKPATEPGPWPNSNHEAATRALRFYVEAFEPGGPSKVEAIRVTMVDLQTPNPPNNPMFPPPNFHAWDIGSPANCASCTGEVCPANPTGQGGCARWVGRPSTFYETQGPPLSGPYRASRLQCTPFYWDWKSEPVGGRVTVVGSEVVPSSQYSVQAYSSTCQGTETSCTNVSPAVTMYTRRSGDVDAEYNPPSATNQPNAIDVAQLVNKFKNAAGSPDHFRAQIQANLPELNASINALDIVAVVDGTKSFAYSFSGPCACPSTVTCGGTCVGCVGICVKKCVGGDNAGEPCINNNHCPGGGSCPANGTCHDRCGRCTP